MSNPRSFRSSLRNFVPKWLSDRPLFQVGFRFLYVFAWLFDLALNAAIQGVRAAWPGSDYRTDSLSLIGDARMRLQGETQTDASFKVTLRAWLSDLRDLGGDAGLAKELHRWLAGNPMVRVITRNGSYTTCAADGTVTRTIAAWDWDSVSNPERNVGGPGSVGRFDLWLVIYPTTASVYPWTSYVATTGHWGDGQDGPGSTHGIGLTVTPAEVDTIRGLITTWKGAHVTPRTLIWSYDVDAFSPSTPSRSGNPDGTWGRWVNASTCLASRNRTHRYTSLGPERL